jgi:hypothetical protein
MLQPVISESEMELFFVNYRAAFRRCMRMIQEKSLLMVEDVREYDNLG